jgi:predicted nucleic acid-binding protein
VTTFRRAALYVFDAACLIELERRNALALLTNLGDRVCIPTPVKREVNKRGTGLERWLAAHPRSVKRFVPGSREEEIYYRLTSEPGPLLGDGEAAAIAMAVNRSAVLVTDDKAAMDVGRAYGVDCMSTDMLLEKPML